MDQESNGSAYATSFDVIGIASSLGGLRALPIVLSNLPQEFPAAILVVQHFSAKSSSKLPELLGRHTKLLVKWAEEGELPRRGTVYIAPPDDHLVVNDDKTLSLSKGSKVQFARPSADVLFNSAAMTHKEHCIAVVLTGRGRDGADGVKRVKELGGRVLVQDPRTSDAFNMPLSAISTDSVDFVLPLQLIPRALIALTMARGAAALFKVPLRPIYRRSFTLGT